MTKAQIIALIIGSEKGLNTNEPASVGGVSFDGVSQKTYDGYFARIRAHIPDAPINVRQLSDRSDVVTAFYELYLGDYSTWLLPEFLQYIYADFAVNAGGAAAKIIQKMVGVDADGIIGSGTKKAIADWKERVKANLITDPSIDNRLIMKFHEAKLAHYKRLVDGNPEKFGKWYAGWQQRATHVLSQLGEYFETDSGTPSAMDDADADVLQKTPVTEPESARAATSESQAEIKNVLKMLLDEVKALKVRVDKVERELDMPF